MAALISGHPVKKSVAIHFHPWSPVLLPQNTCSILFCVTFLSIQLVYLVAFGNIMWKLEISMICSDSVPLINWHKPSNFKITLNLKTEVFNLFLKLLLYQEKQKQLPQTECTFWSVITVYKVEGVLPCLGNRTRSKKPLTGLLLFLHHP